jgi:membrane protease YdiL (CAAX protease family)
MADSASPIPETASAIAQPWLSLNPRRQRWFEVSLVLLVAIAPAFLNALQILHGGSSAAPAITNARWLIGIVQEIAGLLLRAYVLSRRRLRFRDVGLRWSFKEVGIGLLVTGASFAAYVLGSTIVHLVHYGMYGSIARGPSGRNFFLHPSIAFIPFCLLNPFFEELIVRAYLMTEVLDLTGSSILAVALSVAVQFSYHLYYGWAGAFSLSFEFLIFSLYYLRSRQALPIIVAHGLFDIYALVRLW